MKLKMFLTSLSILGIILILLGSCASSKEYAHPEEITTKGYAHPEEIATVEWLSQHHSDENLVILHLSSLFGGKVKYESRHIPGALFVDSITDLSEPSAQVDMMMLNAVNFKRLMNKLGIDKRSTIVVYDLYGGEWAAKLWWGLRYYGHTQVKLLDGGFRKWEKSGYEVETGFNSYPGKGRFKPRKKPHLLADLPAVQEAIADSDIVIIDALSSFSYNSGHIPTAVNIPATDNYHEDYTLLSKNELEELWNRAGLTQTREIITYCGGGSYGSFAFFILRQMGYDKIRLFDGSLAEWRENKLPLKSGSNP